MRVTYVMTCASRSSAVCLRTCAFSARPISISCETEMNVIPARAAAAIGLAGPKGPALHSRRRGRRHLIRAMAAETRVCSCEFNAVHENNGRHVNPQQKDDDRRDRSLDEGEPRVARDVPREAVKREPPEQAGERGADPDVAEARLRVRDEIEDETDAEDE